MVRNRPPPRKLPSAVVFVAVLICSPSLSAPAAAQVQVGITAELQRSVDRELGLDVSGWGVRGELLSLDRWIPTAAYYRADLGVACIPEAPRCPTEEDRFLVGLGIEEEFAGWISPAAFLEAGLRSTSGVRRVAPSGYVAVTLTRWRLLQPRAGLRIQSHEAVGTTPALTLGVRAAVPPG